MMKYNEILNIIKDESAINLIIAGIFACILFFIKYRKVNKNVNKDTNVVNKLDELKHTIGKAKDMVSYVSVFECNARNEMIKDSLVSLYESFCEQLDNFDLEVNHRCSVYGNFLDNVYLSFNKKMVDKNVAKIVIERFSKYNIAHKNVIMSQLRQINKTDDSIVMLMFFVAINSTLETYSQSYIKTLTELNGELTDFEYKNIKCT